VVSPLTVMLSAAKHLALLSVGAKAQSEILRAVYPKGASARSFAALKIVARASRPPWRGHLAREVLRGRDTLATAGETPALHRRAMRLFSWFPGARQPTSMSDCHENDSPPQRRRGQGVVGASVTVPVNHPQPLLNKEGNHFHARW